MKEIDEIINLLTDNSSDLETSLLKTTALLYKLKKKELAKWVEYEINGYPENINIPDYRKMKVQPYGTISMRHQDTLLPTKHIKDQEVLKYFTERHTLISIKEVTRLSIEGGMHPIQPEYYHFLAKGYRENVYITDVYLKAVPGGFDHILANVRNRLLTFLLELKDLFPNDNNTTDSTANQQIEQKFEEIIGFKEIINFGSITVNTGDNNKIEIKNIVKKGDIESLEQALRKVQLPDADIQELKKAIIEDEQSGEDITEEFGSKVMAWTGKIMQKSISGAGSIAAGEMIVEALKIYFGI